LRELDQICRENPPPDRASSVVHLAR